MARRDTMDEKIARVQQLIETLDRDHHYIGLDQKIAWLFTQNEGIELINLLVDFKLDRNSVHFERFKNQLTNCFLIDEAKTRIDKQLDRMIKSIIASRTKERVTSDLSLTDEEYKDLILDKNGLPYYNNHNLYTILSHYKN